MYNVNILTECNDENVRVAIIAAVNEIFNKESDFVVGRMKRLGASAPVWNVFSRQENLNNKF